MSAGGYNPFLQEAYQLQQTQQQRPLPPPPQFQQQLPPQQRPMPPPPQQPVYAQQQQTFPPVFPAAATTFQQPAFQPTFPFQAPTFHPAAFSPARPPPPVVAAGVPPPRPPTDELQKQQFLAATTSEMLVKQQALQEQLQRENEKIRLLEAARQKQLEDSRRVQEEAFARQKRELETIEAARRAAAAEAEAVARMRADWEQAAMERERQLLESSQRQESLNKAGLKNELSLANRRVAQLEAALEAELGRQRHREAVALRAAQAEKKEEEAVDVREEAAAIIGSYNAYMGQLMAASVAAAAEASRLREATRQVVAVVKRTGSEEQKRAVAAAIKETSERSAEFLEQARGEWRTLPMAATMTRLAGEKSAAFARWGVADVRLSIEPEKERAAPPVSPSRIAADFLPKQQPARERAATDSKMTLNLTPQQTRIQAALDSQTAKLKAELRGKPDPEEDKSVIKVKSFAESYY
jgi:hypothetical protein